jgi:hypothetical protein
MMTYEIYDVIATEVNVKASSEDSPLGERVTSALNCIIAPLSHKLWSVYYVVNEGIISLCNVV